MTPGAPGESLAASEVAERAGADPLLGGCAEQDAVAGPRPAVAVAG